MAISVPRVHYPQSLYFSKMRTSAGRSQFRCLVQPLIGISAYLNIALMFSFDVKFATCGCKGGGPFDVMARFDQWHRGFCQLPLFVESEA